MSLPTKSLRSLSTIRPRAINSPPRALFSTTTTKAADPPPSNQPPSAKQANRDSHVASDEQSSASQSENKTGDDHPAKQPDPQTASDRSTGFKEGTPEVKGGKAGLGQRSDR
ncbi:hypothetical protein MBLNU230_g0597t1 [Neophaeotheca triangularis]